MTGKIFINYRRDDSIAVAGRLHDRLAETFGRDNLFMDVDNIPIGINFEEYLNKQVAQSWTSGLLWFAIAFYLGNLARNEKPFAAFARALGYTNESELNAALEKNHRDLSSRLNSAEDRVYAKFGIFVFFLDEHDDACKARFLENQKRMYAGLPLSYRNQLNMPAEVIGDQKNLVALNFLGRSVHRAPACFFPAGRAA